MSQSQTRFLVLAIVVAAFCTLPVGTLTSEADGIVNTWTGSGTYQVWSDFRDLDHRTGIIGLQEACINGFDYVRIRNNDPEPSPLTLEYAFSDNAVPMAPEHKITIAHGMDSSAILVEHVTCDLTLRRYRIYFFQI